MSKNGKGPLLTFIYIAIVVILLLFLCAKVLVSVEVK